MGLILIITFFTFSFSQIVSSDSLPVCPNQTVSFPLIAQYLGQPAFTWALDDSPISRQLDSACTTYFPLPDDPNRYLSFNSYVYTDGTSSVASEVAIDLGGGIISRGNGNYTVIQHIFGLIEGVTIVVCEENEYGEPVAHSAFVSTLGYIDRRQVGQVERVVKNAGVAPTGLYFLPFFYPTRCVTQPPYAVYVVDDPFCP